MAIDNRNHGPSGARRRAAGFLSLLFAAVLLLLVGGAVLSVAGCGRQPVPEAAPAGVALVNAQEEEAAPAVRPAQSVVVATAAATLPSSLTIATAVPTTVTAAPTTAPTQILPSPTVTHTPGPPTLIPTATEPPPLPTPQGIYSWTLKVPILMYHYVSSPPADADQYRRDLSVAPEVFRQQMAYLAENGYETVDLYDLSAAITNKKELPPKPVIITLDDGYRDNYENALPILQEYGFKATFFLVTDFIDQGLPEYVTWEMVQEMAAAGMRLEPHSKTHADLSGQSWDYVIYEILGAQEAIAARIGYTPRYFCYPSGRYDDQTIEVLQSLNFWGAVTTQDGDWHGFNDRFEWRRKRIRQTTDMDEFRLFVDPMGTVAGKFPQ